MAWRGQWDGPWDGGWEGGESGGTGPTYADGAAALAGTASLTGTLSAANVRKVAGDYERRRATFGIPQPLDRKTVDARAQIRAVGRLEATGAVRVRKAPIVLERASVARFEGKTPKTDAAAVRALWLQQMQQDRMARLVAQIEAHHRRLMEEDELWLMVA